MLDNSTVLMDRWLMGFAKCAAELRVWSRNKFGSLPERLRKVQEQLEKLYQSGSTTED